MGPSVQQLLIVLAIVILIFGAKKIPELAKGLGSGIKNFKKAVKEDDEPENTAGAQPQQPQMLNTQAAPQNAAQNVTTQTAQGSVAQPNATPVQPQSTQPQG
ncbi:MAG: twin-arginine translocase TatA/TatE family subunit [Helicobacter sp.]|nr:twin-arginine translocase TatA/TatE family subunit [Helicobacter sp.]